MDAILPRHERVHERDEWHDRVRPHSQAAPKGQKERCVARVNGGMRQAHYLYREQHICVRSVSQTQENAAQKVTNREELPQRVANDDLAANQCGDMLLHVGESGR